MDALRRDLSSLVDLRLYAERLPTSERQELLCAVCLSKDDKPSKGSREDVIPCPLYRGGQRLCGQTK